MTVLIDEDSASVRIGTGIVEGRLATFITWPLMSPCASDMANAGFYYLGKEDFVKCVSCCITIGKWVYGEDPAIEHCKYAPQCDFVQSRDECGIYSMAGTCTVDTDIAHPSFESYEARLASFAKWNKEEEPSPLARASLFYVGYGDMVKCYKCDATYWDSKKHMCQITDDNIINNEVKYWMEASFTKFFIQELEIPSQLALCAISNEIKRKTKGFANYREVVDILCHLFINR